MQGSCFDHYASGPRAWSFTAEKGLIAHYTFDDGTASDSAFLGNHGTLTAATSVPGLLGQGMSFADNSARITIANRSSLNPTSQLTVAAWYKPVSFSGNGNNPIVDKGYTSHSPPYYQYHLGVTGDLYPREQGEFSFWVATSEAGGAGVGTPLHYWSAGNWYHLAGTYDGSAVKLYVNGELVDVQPLTGSLATFATPVVIGNYTNFDNVLPGTIDDVRLYDRALSIDEVRGLAGATTNEPDVTPPYTFISDGPQDGDFICSDATTFTLTGDDDFSLPSALLFQYNLDGSGWSAPQRSPHINLSGLSDGEHRLEVAAVDEAGNVDSSPPQRTFTIDREAPLLSAPTVVPSDVSATVSWTTSKPTSSRIVYVSASEPATRVVEDATKTLVHHVVLSGLSPSTEYDYQLVAADACWGGIAGGGFTTTASPLSNLTVSSLTFPLSVAQAGALPVTWRVHNGGTSDAVGAWTDAVYLSADATLDATDVVLARGDSPGRLPVQASYISAQQLTVPDVESGNYFLILSVDDDHSLTESDAADNILALPLQITRLRALVAAPSNVDVAVVAGSTATVNATLTNLGENTLTGLRATVDTPAANVTVQATVASSLESGASQTIDLLVTASGELPAASEVAVRIADDQGDNAIINLQIAVRPARSNLVVTPGTLSAGMVRGQQGFVSLEIANTGSAMANDVIVGVPAAPWLSLSTPANLGDLAPGRTLTASFALRPAADLPLGPYSGSISISSGADRQLVPFTFDCVSEAKGNLRIVAQDEFSYFAAGKPNVAGASITVKDAYTGVIAASGVTDATGAFAANSLPESTYSIEARAAKHGSAKLVTKLIPGKDNLLTAFLPRELVSYVWQVVPVQTEDKYQVTLESVFETHVPAPVVTVDPMFLDARKLTFDSHGQAIVNYTITNQGLIAANDVNFNFPVSNSIYLVEPTITKLGTLAAKSSVVVPVVVTRIGGESVYAEIPADQCMGHDDGTACDDGVACTVGDACLRGHCRAGVPSCTETQCDAAGLTDDTIGRAAEQAMLTLAERGVVIDIRTGADVDTWDALVGETVKALGCSADALEALAPSSRASSRTNASEGTPDCTVVLGEEEFQYNPPVHYCGPDARIGACTGIFNRFSVVDNCMNEVCYQHDRCYGSSNGPGQLCAGSANICIWGATTKQCDDQFDDGHQACVVNNQCGFRCRVVYRITQVLRGMSFFHQPLENACRAAKAFSLNTCGSNGGACRKDGVVDYSFVCGNLQNRSVMPAISTGECPPVGAGGGVYIPATFYGPGTTSSSSTGQPPGSSGSGSSPLTFESPPAIQTNLGCSPQQPLAGNEVVATEEALAAGQVAAFAYGAAIDADSIQSVAPEEGVCARVRIRLTQDVALTRTNFQATLELTDSPENVPLENLSVTLDIRDATEQPAGALFSIGAPVTTNVSDVAGGGVVAPGSTAGVSWMLVPLHAAAPENPTQYFVGGTLSYTQDGVPITVPLFPAVITVRPDPQLSLRYFWQRDVYGDDPFTPEVEPAEPFSLGLLAVNHGHGSAHDLQITSSQPRIVDNEKGLLVDFKIVGTRVNAAAAAPSLKVHLGDIGPAETSTATWLMTSTLQGTFVDYAASFEHVNDLGNQTSLIDSVDIHQLEHLVRVIGPADDGKPDFLVDDVADPDDLPDSLYLSDGTQAPITAITTGSTDGPVATSRLQIHFLAAAQSGHVYYRTDDPGQDAYRLVRVVRADGRELRLGDNAWTTHRTIRLVGQAPFRQSRLYLFDNDSPGGYVLTYQAIGATVAGNHPPTIETNVDVLPVEEGVVATNDGHWADADGDTVTLSASVGTVQRFADGTWRWVYAVDEASPPTVSIDASDGKDTTSVSFQLFSSQSGGGGSSGAGGSSGSSGTSNGSGNTNGSGSGGSPEGATPVPASGPWTMAALAIVLAGLSTGLRRRHRA